MAALDAGEWNRRQRIFQKALDLPAEHRRDYVSAACGGDSEAEAEILALLREDSAGSSFLERGLAGAAEALLGGSPAIPPQIGPYRILRRLAQGGMGVVYLAEREDFDRTVAIKLLPDAGLTPEREQRFLQERRILALFDHPLICRLFDAGVLTDGTPYLIMEYLDGVPLTTYCEEKGLGLEARLRCFRQACVAVQHAHRHLLIHRDIKPENILALAGDEEGRPAIKLLDFGIAKHLEAAGEGQLTATGRGPMTLAYASPEQLSGDPLTVATDVYSLGLILYRLLTGTLPFDFAGLGPAEAAERVRSRQPEPPWRRVRGRAGAPSFVSSVGARVWADLNVLCLTALASEPERRFPTVEAFLRDLDHFLDGEPLEARPAGLMYRLGKFVRRNRGPVAAGILLAGFGVGLSAFYTYRLAKARDAAVAEAASAQRIRRFLLGLFESEDPDLPGRRDFTVGMLMERGVREAQGLESDPALQAELFQIWGEAYRRMARFDRSQALLEEALKRRRLLYGDRDPEVGDSLRALSLLRVDQDDLKGAERLIREALARVQAGVSRQHPAYAETLGALGMVLRSQGRYQAAIEHLGKAVRLQEESGDVGGLISTLGTLAEAHWYLGNYREADHLNRRRLTLIEGHLGTNHPAYAETLSNLGASREQLGFAEEAEGFYRRALRINEAYHGREHPSVASNLSLLGQLLNSQGRHEEARRCLEEALDLRERIFGPNHTDVARTLSHLADFHLSRRTPKDLAVAEAYFNRELAIYRATFSGPHPWIATAISNLATVAFRRGQLDLAEKRQREALAVYKSLLQPNHVDVAIAQIKLGQVLAERRKYAEALEHLLEGHRILATQANPSMPWVASVKAEIASVYEALGDPARAAEFRR
jgi:eukaryotic-like serine/threonine-protein kinase